MNPPKSFIQRVTGFLRGWNNLTHALEVTLIDNIAATIPWLAPIVPAYMIFHNLYNVIGFPPLVAGLSALVVEFLGLATVHTTFQFWDWNDARRKTDQQAPVQVAAAAAGFYLLVVIVVNVILDNAPLGQQVAKALLSTLSIIAAVTLAIRSQHARRLSDREQEKAERKANRTLAISGEKPAPSGKTPNNVPERSPQPAGNLPQDAAGAVSDWRLLSDGERQAIAGMRPRQVMNLYPVSDRTAREWVSKSKNGVQA